MDGCLALGSLEPVCGACTKIISCAEGLRPAVQGPHHASHGVLCPLTSNLCSRAEWCLKYSGLHACEVDTRRRGWVSPFPPFNSPIFLAPREGPNSPANPILFPGYTDRSYSTGAPPPTTTMLIFMGCRSLCPLISLSVRTRRG